MTAAQHPWAEALPTLHDHAWHRLVRGVHDRHAPARHPTLATVSPEGLPQMRTVVLRAADRGSRRLSIYTSLHSGKVRDAMARPAAALHVWDAQQRLQIRLEAEVELATGAAAAEAWNQVPAHSRSAYSAQVPGEPLPHALAYGTEPDPAAFVVFHLHVVALDVLHLGAQHRRARFCRADGWAGQWLAP